MPGVIFAETLRRSWRSAFFWGIGSALIASAQILILPDVDSLKQFARLIQTLPPMLIQMIGGDDAAFLGTPEGYLAARFYSLALIIFAIYALNCGLNVTANEEDRGILDVVMSLPIPRWRLVTERLLAYAVTSFAIVTITFFGIVISLSITPALEIETGKILATTFNILPGTLLVLAFTTLVGTALRHRSMAVALGVIFIIGSYIINFIGGMASGTLADSLRVVSFFTYYDSTTVMKSGLQWGNVLILLVVTLVCAAGSLWFFERRDIGI